MGSLTFTSRIMESGITGEPMSDIASNVRSIRERISSAAAECGRSAGEITLIAISKTFPVEAIAAALAAGVECIGENRVQEAEPKILHFQGIASPEWHMVGHLQSNKARRAAELFHMIHSVDGARLARKLSAAASDIGKTLRILLQTDLGGEETKFGLAVDRIRETVEEIAGLPGLRLDGLMTLPPFFQEPERTRPFFARLREVGERLEHEQPGCLGRKHLSMGMTHDFEVAIAEGSTMVRIGTAIFGRRT